MQADPIKPTLIPPGAKRLKLEYDGLLSNFGFKFSLRRYTRAANTCSASPQQWRNSLQLRMSWHCACG